ncbi:hypothetical protein CALVIDRAFT_535763 [Calocera viscosa TUFC12733]|uniref:Uncharacterized protein n=1 Tax=Calocera viscosa (strain TUFC12733) TaxID=1330018 RepID=A0A167NXJ4_CALVF|nr:hypothetical protein CALVIDRAFT_535763 [Calocera viscosa TUFC12733]
MESFCYVNYIEGREPQRWPASDEEVKTLNEETTDAEESEDEYESHGDDVVREDTNKMELDREWSAQHLPGSVPQETEPRLPDEEMEVGPKYDDEHGSAEDHPNQADSDDELQVERLLDEIRSVEQVENMEPSKSTATKSMFPLPPVNRATSGDQSKPNPPLPSKFFYVVQRLFKEHVFVQGGRVVLSGSQAQQHVRQCFAIAPKYLADDCTLGLPGVIGWVTAMCQLIFLVCDLSKGNTLELQTLKAVTYGLCLSRELASPVTMVPLSCALDDFDREIAELEKKERSKLPAPTHVPDPAVFPNPRVFSLFVPSPLPTSPFAENVFAELSHLRNMNGGLMPTDLEAQTVICKWMSLAPAYLMHDCETVPHGDFGWSRGLQELVGIILLMRREEVLECETVVLAMESIKTCVAWAKHRGLKSITPMLKAAINRMEGVYDRDDERNFMGQRVRDVFREELEYA